MEQWDSVGESARSGADEERSPDDGLDFSDSVWQASVYCPCIKVDAPGSNAKRLEDETVAAENTASE
jgi:hypothetical protein